MKIQVNLGYYGSTSIKLPRATEAQQITLRGTTTTHRQISVQNARERAEGAMFREAYLSRRKNQRREEKKDQRKAYREAKKLNQLMKIK